MTHAHNYYPDYLWRNQSRVPLEGNVVRAVGRGGVATKRTEYSHDLFTAEALSFIEKNQQRPFFLYLALTIPHANNEAGGDGMEVPDASLYKDREWPQPQKNHAAMITRLDDTVGQVVEKLRVLDLSRNTLLLFTSDNGPHAEGGADPKFFNSSGGLRGHKRDLYEGGIRVPLIAHWPGTVPAGQTTDHLSAFWDFVPTVAEVAGVQSPRQIDGVSFLPTLLGKPDQQPKHDFLYWEFHERGSKQAARNGKWKLVRELGGRSELYDLQSDPGELLNVAEQNPTVVQSIESMLQTSRTEPAKSHHGVESNRFQKQDNNGN